MTYNLLPDLKPGAMHYQYVSRDISTFGSHGIRCSFAAVLGYARPHSTVLSRRPVAGRIA